MKPYILGAIFARGGSKGVPKKNLKLLGGKPLIAYAIETAQNVPDLDDIIVSTDDVEIARVARQYGAEVPFLRPAELATDEAPMRLAQKHALEEYQKLKNRGVDILVSIPPTSPLRATEDVTRCIETLLSSDADCALTITESNRNPYFNMVIKDSENNLRLVIKPQSIITRRQDAPVVFDVTTVCYAIRTEYFKKNKPLLEGKVKGVIVPAERAWDIDTDFDFEVAELLLTQKVKA